MKLPNGYGSVHKLPGKRRNPFRARKTIGWELVDGKAVQKYVTVGYYPTKSEALQALAAYNQDPYDLHHDTITFAEVYDKWSEQKFETISASNVKGYKASYALCSKLYDMKFQDIKLDHLQKVVDESGKNTPTLKKLKTMFSMIWEYAVIHEIVTQDKKDFIQYIDISKPGNPDARNRKPFTKKQIQLLWDNKEGNIYITIILMLVYTGVRIGELLDLKKENVHLDERWFYVNKSKTDAGIREVPIAEKIVPFFEYWIKQPSEYLVCTPEGEHFQYRNYFDSYWSPLMSELNLQEYTPHCTRHTCISLLTMEGVDERVIRKIVGHKGQGVTETVYTHLELPIKLEAINRI